MITNSGLDRFTMMLASDRNGWKPVIR